MFFQFTDLKTLPDLDSDDSDVYSDEGRSFKQCYRLYGTSF